MKNSDEEEKTTDGRERKTEKNPPATASFPSSVESSLEMVSGVSSASTYDDFTVFPPSLHEGLLINSDYEPSRSLDPSSVEGEEGEGNSMSWVRISNASRRMIMYGVEMINSKISILDERKRVTSRVWSFAAMAGLVGVLIYLRRRNRREMELILLLIKEKDQRIGELLNQIALLNQISGARYVGSVRGQVALQ